MRRAHRLHGSNGNHIWIVAGRINGAIALVAKGIVAAVIARGDNHHDTGLPRQFNRLAERICLVALENRMAQRKIDDANVVGVLELDGSLDGGDHKAVGAIAVAI